MDPAVVLVVDDDPDVRAIVRLVLETDGYRIIEASTGPEALEALRSSRPSLVLLDVMMPAMDGFAVAGEMRQTGARYVPLILLTALDDPASRARGIAAGADEVLAKPVRPFELRLRVRAMLRIHQLVAELRGANRRLRLAARTDELTGVRNRRGVRIALKREFLRASRYGHPLTLLALDVDHFKRVNDSHGHQAGDRVLAGVAAALKAGIRNVDVLGRTGGEEFVVIAPETQLGEGRRMAERLRRAVGTLQVPVEPGLAVGVTISCGIATLGAVRAGSAEELVRLADQALYRAKALGRDRSEVASVDPDPPPGAGRSVLS